MLLHKCILTFLAERFLVPDKYSFKVLFVDLYNGNRKFLQVFGLEPFLTITWAVLSRIVKIFVCLLIVRFPV